jgi:hypothetical protein
LLEYNMWFFTINKHNVLCIKTRINISFSIKYDLCSFFLSSFNINFKDLWWISSIHFPCNFQFLLVVYKELLKYAEHFNYQWFLFYPHYTKKFFIDPSLFFSKITLIKLSFHLIEYFGIAIVIKYKIKYAFVVITKNLLEKILCISLREIVKLCSTVEKIHVLISSHF